MFAPEVNLKRFCSDRQTQSDRQTETESQSHCEVETEKGDRNRQTSTHISCMFSCLHFHM